VSDEITGWLRQVAERAKAAATGPGGAACRREGGEQRQERPGTGASPRSRPEPRRDRGCRRGAAGRDAVTVLTARLRVDSLFDSEEQRRHQPPARANKEEVRGVWSPCDPRQREGLVLESRDEAIQHVESDPNAQPAKKSTKRFDWHGRPRGCVGLLVYPDSWCCLVPARFFSGSHVASDLGAVHRGCLVNQLNAHTPAVLRCRMRGANGERRRWRQSQQPRTRGFS
jgi:hypothetical protein